MDTLAIAAPNTPLASPLASYMHSEPRAPPAALLFFLTRALDTTRFSQRARVYDAQAGGASGALSHLHATMRDARGSLALPYTSVTHNL